MKTSLNIRRIFFSYLFIILDTCFSFLLKYIFLILYQDNQKIWHDSVEKFRRGAKHRTH